MKKWVGGAVAGLTVAFVTGSALADGLPERGVYASRPDCARFAGFYLGGSAGSVSYTAHQLDEGGFLQSFTSGSATAGGTRDGFAGGVQAGYNFQRHCTVFGIEADWSWSGVHVDTRFFEGDPSVIDVSAHSTLRSFGTLRTRSGIVVDQSLLYVTGGLAWADIHNSVTEHAGPPTFVTVNETHSWSDARLGWTAGIGIEYALTHNISIKSEALYLSFADHTSGFISPIVFCPSVSHRCDFKTDESTWVARIGLNFRFGGDRDVMPIK
jgi:outer membrane immunogenic protein